MSILLRHQDFLHEQQIADELAISKRTVQRELDYITTILAPYQLTLTRKKGAGLLLAGTPQARQRLADALNASGRSDWSDKRERRRYLLFELLRDRTPKKLYHYSRLLGVSESTAASDLESLGPWLRKNNLSVLKKPGFGVVLNGTEQNYREAMRRFISETAPVDKLKEITDPHAALAKAVMNVTDNGIYRLLNSHTIQRIDALLGQMNEPKLRQFTDSAYIGLIIHIAISVERMQQGNVPSDEQSLPLEEDGEDLRLAQRILQAIEEEFHLHMPELELSYLLLHIKGANMHYTNVSDETVPTDLNGQKLINLIDAMIDAFDSRQTYMLRCDEEFIRGLFVHLQPAIVRLTNHLNIINPLLDDIKEEYADTFQKSIRAARVLEKAIGAAVSEEEIGYLTIHFGAALERMKGKTAFTRKVSVGIVCASGFGVARLTMTRLRNKLSAAVSLKTYGKGDLTPEVIKATDFFVSSLPLNRPDIDAVRISPLITQSDMSRIQCKIEEYAHIRKQVHREEGEKQPDEFVQELAETHKSAEEIAHILKGYAMYTADASLPFDQAVAWLCGQVAESESQSRQLYEDIMKRERLSSQIFPDQGFALLHCRTCAVSHAAFYTCMPSESSFSDPYFQGVGMILLMAMPAAGPTRLYTDLLGFISSSLVIDDSFNEAVLSRKEGLIRSELQRILKLYFNTLLIKLT